MDVFSFHGVFLFSVFFRPNNSIAQFSSVNIAQLLLANAFLFIASFSYFYFFQRKKPSWGNLHIIFFFRSTMNATAITTALMSKTIQKCGTGNPSTFMP